MRTLVRLDAMSNFVWLDRFRSEPWLAVLRLPSILLELLQGRPAWVDSTAHVEGTAKVINSYVCAGASVYEGVTLRDTIILPGATVGHVSEIARSIIGPECMIPRFNYVGSSLLGSRVQLGGGTMLASRRHDRKPIALHWGSNSIQLQATQFGSIVGDSSTIAYGCHLNPGSVVGHESTIMPMVDLNGFVPSRSVVRVRQSTTVFPRRETVVVEEG